MKLMTKILLVLFFLGCFTLSARPSYAYWHEHHSWVGINVGWPYYGYPYYEPYYSPYYYPTYVETSASYQPVVINGVTYYVNNGAYYIYTQYGYQAVAAPTGASITTVTAATPAAVTDTDDSFTVNVPNDKGGYTAVLLKKSGTGFIGPQGEFYSDFPKISQLRAMYGK